MLMKDELEDFLGKFGVFKVGIADCRQGFKMAKSGCRPKDVMENCKSVVVFALHVGLDYYTSWIIARKVTLNQEGSAFIVTGFHFSLPTFSRTRAVMPLFHTALKMKKRRLLAYHSSWLHTKRDLESLEDQAS